MLIPLDIRRGLGLLLHHQISGQIDAKRVQPAQTPCVWNSRTGRCRRKQHCSHWKTDYLLRIKLGFWKLGFKLLSFMRKTEWPWSSISNVSFL